MLAAVLMSMTLAVSSTAGAAQMLPALTVHGAFTNYSLSPDGRTLALLEPAPTGSKIEIIPTDGGASSEVSTGGYTVGDVDWIDDGHLAIATRFMINGNEAIPRQMVTQFLSYDRRDGKVTTLLAGTDGVMPIVAGGPVVYGRYQGRSVAFMKGIARNLRFPLMAADAETGVGTKLEYGDFNVQAYGVTPEGRIGVVQMLDANSKSSRLSFRTGGAGREVRLAADMQPFTLLGLGRTADTALIAQSGRLVEVAPTNRTEVLASGRSRAIFNRRTGLLEAIALPTFSNPITVYDNAFGAKWKAVQAALPGLGVRFIEADEDNGRFLVSAGRSEEEAHFYWVDLTANVARPVLSGKPAWARSTLVSHPFQFKTRDGHMITEEVVFPSTSSSPPPLVVWVARFNGSASQPVGGVLKMLIERGYAALLIESSGPGDGGSASYPADRHRIDGPLQTDIADAVASLAVQHTIDASRVCIGGSGYGGYVAMMAITAADAAYRCAAVVDPLINLSSVTTFPQVETRSDAWESVPAWRKFIGEENLTAARLKALSPTSRAVRASGPVLLVDGTIESESTYHQAQLMAHSLKSAGKAVSLVVVPRRVDRGDVAEGSPGATAVTDFIVANDR